MQYFSDTLWYVVSSCGKPVENFGIDTVSIQHAIMGLHVNNKKGATWTRSLGKPSWLNQIST